MKYETGMKVISPKGEGVIVSVSKGWVSVSVDGVESKHRAKELKPAGDVSMPEYMKGYRAKYTRSESALGNKSFHNGDELAQVLVGMNPEEVCTLADQLIPSDDGTPYLERYQHLNAGQIRMNAGNRLRAAWKRGDINPADLGI